MIETKFKQTEVGQIPMDWDVYCLETISDIKTGPFGSSLHASDYVRYGTPIITVEHLGEPYILHATNIPLVGERDKKRLAQYSLRTGDIVYSRVGSVDRNSVVTEQEEGWLFSGRLLRVRNTFGYNASYLGYHLNSYSAKQRIISAAVGLGMPSINTKILGEHSVILPKDINEQARIAEALSDVDKLIRELDTLIEKKRSIMQGTMQELLTARRRLPEFNEQWKSMTFEDIGALIRGVGFSPEQSSHKHKRGSMPLLRANNIKNNSLIFNELIYVSDDCVKHTQVLREADILICTANGSSNLVGKSVIIPQIENFTFGAFMTILRCHDKRIAKYIIYFMRSSSYRKQITDLLCGSAINNINSRQLYTISVQCPSNIDEMNEIASVLSDMDTEIEELEAKRDKYIAVRQGMMQQLLTGKIRLI